MEEERIEEEEEERDQQIVTELDQDIGWILVKEDENNMLTLKGVHSVEELAERTQIENTRIPK